MRKFLLVILLCPSFVLAVDDATVQAIDSKASSANAKANGNNSRIQALEAEDLLLHSRIDNIQLTPGPQGEQGPPGPQGDPGPDQGGARELPGYPGGGGGGLHGDQPGPAEELRFHLHRP